MSGIDKWGDRFERRPWWTTLRGAVAIVVIVLVCVALVGLATTGSVLFAGPAAKLTNPSRVQQKVYDPSNTIAQVAFFHDQCEAVNAAVGIVRDNEATYQADLKAARYATDPIRRQQAQDALAQDAQNVSGAKNVLLTRIADYNSRSEQRTANVFKDAGLPARIDPPVDHVDCGPGR